MAKWLDKYEQSECDSCKKAQLGKKYGKSEDEVRRAILKKADEVFTSGKKPYELPESVLKAGANKGYVCIRGVCGILTDAGFLPDKYYTNTSFAKDAPELGFGNPQTNINLLKEGDVFMHLADKNEQGNLYPSHAEIFKGWDGDMGEFYDYYDLYNSPYKTNGIRRYAKSELENRLRRKAQNDQSDTQAQFYSLAGSEAKTEKPYPYNLPENELKDWYERTHASNTTFIAPDSKIDRDMPLYYASGENIRQDTKDELVSMFNNKDLDKQLKRELKITDHDLQRIKPLIYGVIGQESQFNNPRSVTAGAKYMYENMFSPEGNSLGPGQVKLKSITPAVREAFGIAKGEDLQNLKNTYIGLTDIISNAVNYTDKYVTEETHPDLVDKDRFERALYFLNSPGKVRKSDSQNYNESLDDASYFSRLTEEGRQENVNRANKTKLSMDPGSYPAKVLERAKELQTKIKYEDPSILPDVLVTSTKKENGGWLDKYEQGGLILKKKTKDNYGKKPNVNDVKVSAGPNFVGEGYTAYNWKSPAWGGQFAMGGSLPGSVGFTYARVAGSAPANGKYTKKTKASAQDGKVLSPDADDRLMLGFNTSDPAFQNVKSNAFVPFDRKDFEGIKQGIAGYMNSPLYMERLSKSIPDAENAKETQQRRLNNLLSIKLNPNTVNEGTHYNSNKNRINLGATDFVDNATLSHEVAHGIVPNLTNSYGKQNMFAKAANVVGDLFQPFEQFSNSELEKINVPLSGKITAPNFDYMMARKEEHYKPQGSKASAKTAANETYGDLTGMRQLLLDNGITTEFGQDLTPEIFKKATENKRVMNSPAFKRMKLKFKDEDIIKMNNEVAMNDNAAPLTQAQNGRVLNDRDPVRQKMYGAPEEDKVIDWFKQYYGSDFFKTNLERGNAKVLKIDPEKISKSVINDIDNTKTVYAKTDKEATYSFPGRIIMGNPEIYGNQPKNETYAHEQGHTGQVNLLASQYKNLEYMGNRAKGRKKYIYDLQKNLLAPIAQNSYGPEFKSEDEKRRKVLNDYAENEINLAGINHGFSQTEQRADIMALRYLAAKKGIWDASKSKPGSFTAEMLNKLYKTKELNTPITNKSPFGTGVQTTQIPDDLKKGDLKNVAPPKSPGTILPELRRNFKDSDILYLMNNLAKNEGEAPTNKAQNGQEMKFYQEGLDFKPKSISKNGSVIKDDRGQWAHPGEVTEIGSNDITMQGVDYPVLGISDTGDTKMMQPGEDYKFDGEKITEFPMMEKGGWLDKYKAQDGKSLAPYGSLQGDLPIVTVTSSKPSKWGKFKFAPYDPSKNPESISQWNPKPGEREAMAAAEKARRDEANSWYNNKHIKALRNSAFADWKPYALAGGVTALPTIGSALGLGSTSAAMSTPMVAGITANHLLGAAAVTHGINKLPETAQSVRTAYNNPNYENIANAISDVGWNALDLAPAVPTLSKIGTEAKGAYNTVATGESALPIAWKSPAVGLSQEASADMFRGLSNANKLSDADRALLLDYQYNSKPFTGRWGTIDQSKKDALNNIIKNNELNINNNAILTRRFNPTNQSLGAEFESGRLNLGDRPSSFSAGVGLPNYGSGAVDRLVVPNRYAKQMGSNLLANEYGIPSDKTFNLLNDKSKNWAASIGVNPTDMINAEREILGTGLDLRRIGRVKNDIGGYDHIVRPKDATFAKYLTEETPLKNAYKLNPKAFTPTEGMMYRGLGKEGMEDAFESGVFRAKQDVEPIMLGRFDASKQFSKAYYSPQFNIADQYGKGYIAEVPRTASDWGRRYGRKEWSQIAQKDIPITEGKILQKDWWKGYKEVPRNKMSAPEITRGPINWWESPTFKKNNPNYDPTKPPLNPFPKYTAENVPEGLDPYLVIDDDLPDNYTELPDYNMKLKKGGWLNKYK